MAKTLVKLNSIVQDETLHPVQINKEGVMVPARLGDLLVLLLLRQRGVNITESMRTYNEIVPKMRDSKDEVELDSSDYQLVKRAVERNEIGYVVNIQMQLLKTFDEYAD